MTLTGTQGLLLPVRVRDCALRGLLRPIVYIDLRGLEEEAARERLLAGVLRQRMKPTREPGFPGHTSGSLAAPPLFPGSIPQTISLLGAAFIPGGASKFRGQIEAFLEEYLVTETRTRTVPFGGRDEDVALLDTWLEGKSALLVRWLQHLLRQGRVGPDSPVSWQLVFVPISIRFETHAPDIFLEAIATRLAEILGIELQPTHTDKDRYYANHCREL